MLAGCPPQPRISFTAPPAFAPSRIPAHAGFPSHVAEQGGMNKCDKTPNAKTRFLSVRVQPALAEAVAEEADDYGVSPSKFVRIVLIDTVQKRRMRRQMLGLGGPARRTR